MQETVTTTRSSTEGSVDYGYGSSGTVSGREREAYDASVLKYASSGTASEKEHAAYDASFLKYDYSTLSKVDRVAYDSRFLEGFYFHPITAEKHTLVQRQTATPQGAPPRLVSCCSPGTLQRHLFASCAPSENRALRRV